MQDFSKKSLKSSVSAPIDWIQPMTKRKNPSVVDAARYIPLSLVYYKYGIPESADAISQYLRMVFFCQLSFIYRNLWQSSWGNQLCERIDVVVFEGDTFLVKVSHLCSLRGS